MDMIHNRRRAIIICASIILAVLVMVLILTLLLSKEHKETCLLTDKPPVVNVADKPAIPSQNKRALVRFAGYLRIWKRDDEVPSPNRFLDLDLQKVHYAVFSEEDIHLTLDADCSAIDFEVHKDSSTNMFHVKTITVKPKTSHAKFKDCQIFLTDINFPTDHYWSCTSDRSYICSGVTGFDPSESYGVELNFNLLDIELDGNPEDIARGDFMKNGTSCID